MVSIDIIGQIYGFVSKGISFRLEKEQMTVSAKHNTGSILKQDLARFMQMHQGAILELLSVNGGLISASSGIIKHNLLDTPLSLEQQGVWLLDQIEEGCPAYNIPLLFELDNLLDNNLIESAVRLVVLQNEILRSTFHGTLTDGAHQSVHALTSENFVLRHYLLASNDELREKRVEEQSYRFNLAKELPIRAAIFDLSGGKRYLSLIIHHIAFDGGSIDLLTRELNEVVNTKVEYSKLRLQYKDMALWQYFYSNPIEQERQLNYWKEQLRDFSALNLVTDYPRSARFNYSGADLDFLIPIDISDALRGLAKVCGVSLYSVLLAAFYLLLSIYTRQNDIVIGNAVSNRTSIPGVEELMGLFVNSVALRVQINTKGSVKDFIKIISNSLRSAQLNQDVPFEKIVSALKIPRDLSQNPVFQVVFGFYNFGAQENKAAAFRPFRHSVRTMAKYDMSLYIDDSEQQLKGLLNYATSLFSGQTIFEYAHTYLNILKQFTVEFHSSTPLHLEKLNYLDDEQKKQILFDWNETQKSFPTDGKTLTEVFEQQVALIPEGIAVIYKDYQLTYKELNEQITQLASCLLEKCSITSNQLIAINMDRSEKMLVAILAILKIGGGYVPINPDYPDDRIIYILQDTQVQVVIHDEAHAVRLQNLTHYAGLQKKIQRLGFESLIAQTVKLTATCVVPSDKHSIAYIIYTSGTTGKPKGVMIEQYSVLNYISNLREHFYGQQSQQKVDFSTNIAFDLSVSTTLGALLSGNTVCIYPEEVSDVDGYIEHLIANGITRIKHVPSYFELMIDHLTEDQAKKLRLSAVMLGGEKVTQALLKKTFLKLKLAIYEEYGPTETTVGSHIAMVDCLEKLSSHNLGRPYSNYTTYVLNEHLQPLPVGAIGELYIGGKAVARGYLNKPDVTQERFITNPFQSLRDLQTHTNAILYKTGDLVRYARNGTLYYVSRADTQVKLNGHRIELGEIEAVLLSYPAISQAAVILKNVLSETSEHKLLAGYYVSYEELDDVHLTYYLKSKLPQYMIPKVLLRLPQLPLTVNGKLDIKALVEIEIHREGHYASPRDSLDEALAKIWLEVLGVDNISIDDGFFALGGDSLSAIHLIAAINKHFHRHFRLDVIFANNTIRSLAAFLKVESAIEEGEI